MLAFRQLTLDDAGEALTVQLAAFVTEGRISGNLDIPPLTDTLDDMRREISTTVTSGVFDGPRLVASLRLTLEDTTGWISRVAVAPDQQGRGIGSLLLENAERTAPAVVREFKLIAAAESHDNVRFYQRRGYEVVGERPDAVGVPMYLMAKPRVDHQP